MIIENVDESVDETKETDKNIDDSEISTEKPINESGKLIICISINLFLICLKC